MNGASRDSLYEPLLVAGALAISGRFGVACATSERHNEART